MSAAAERCVARAHALLGRDDEEDLTPSQAAVFRIAALSSAAEVHAAAIRLGDTPRVEDIIDTADSFLNWILCGDLDD
jgi:hypothetical protein